MNNRDMACLQMMVVMKTETALVTTSVVDRAHLFLQQKAQEKGADKNIYEIIFYNISVVFW